MQLTSEPTAMSPIELEANAAHLTVVDRDATDDLGAAAVLAEAEAEADRIRAAAKRDALQMYSSASTDSRELIENAQAEAAQITQAARDEAAAVAAPEPVAAVPAAETRPMSPYDIVDEAEPETPSPFDEPERVSRYAKHAAEIPHLGEAAGRDAVATATSLRDLLRR